MKTTRELKAGDVRQLGDEVLTNDGYNIPFVGYEPDPRLRQLACADGYANHDWSPVRLVGQTILPSDLIAATFRRPL